MQDFIELKSRINRLLDEVMARGDAGQASGSGEWSPKVDLYDLPDRFVLRADIPGVRDEDLEIRLEGHHLVLRGAREQPSEPEASSLLRVERPFGSFVRRYALPDVIDADQVSAKTQDGVLEVVVRKREPRASRRIDIERS